MQGINEFFHIVVGMLKEADAKRNIEDYLRPQIRKEFIEKINMDTILNSMVSKAEDLMGEPMEEAEDKEIFKQDIVDDFIDDRADKDLMVQLLRTCTKKGISRDEEDTFLSGAGKETKEIKEKVEKFKDEFGKMIYSYIRTYLSNRTHKWVDAKYKNKDTKEIVEKGEKENQSQRLNEKELDSEIKNEYDWEEGLIKDVLGLINSKVKEEKRSLYKLILKERFLAKNKKTFKQLEELSGTDEKTVEKDETRLINLLRSFLKNHGLPVNFSLSKENVEIPPSEEILENKENRDDFKDYLRSSIKTRNDQEKTFKILDLLIDGKKVGEISEELKMPKSTVQQVKNLYFDKYFKEWYTEMVEDMRQACTKVIEAAGKTVRIDKPTTPEETEKSEKVEKDILQVHENMIEKALKEDDVFATVTFSAKFDNMSFPDGVNNSNKEDEADFKWKKYEFDFDIIKHGTDKRPDRSVYFKYTHDLNEDGTIKEAGQSILKADGKEIPKTDPLSKYVHDHLEKVILKEGAIPHGEFPVRYINIKNGKKYLGTTKFLKMFDGIFVPDTAHEKRTIEKQEWIDRKTLKPTEEFKVKRVMEDLKDQLKEEEDLNKKTKIRESIKDLEDLMENKSKMDLDEIEEMIKEEELLRNPTEPHAKEAFDYDLIQESNSIIADYDQLGVSKFAGTLPGPQSGDAKDLISLFLGYGLDKNPNPKLWLVPLQLITMSRSYRNAVELKLKKEMKEKKPKGMDQEEWESSRKSLESEYKSDVEKVRKMFPDFIEDLKTRKDKFKKESPVDYADWSKGKNIAWVDNNVQVNDTISKINHELSKVPDFKSEKIEPRPTKMLDRNKWAALEGFLDVNKDGFGAIGQRLEHASIQESANDYASKEFLGKLRSDFKFLTEQNKNIRETIKEMQRADMVHGRDSEESQKKIDEFEREFMNLNSDLESILKAIDLGGKIPAHAVAKALDRYATYFSKLYSIYSNVIWVKDKYSYEILAEKEEKEEKEETIESLEPKLIRSRNAIAKRAEQISGSNIRIVNKVKSKVRDLRDSLKDFLSDMDKLEHLYAAARRVHKAADPKKEESYEDRLRAFIFPEPWRMEAEKVIKKIKEKKSEAAPKAEKEYKDLVDNMIKAFKEESFEDKIEEVAKKQNISKEKAAIQLKKHEEAFAKAAINSFVRGWEDFLTLGEDKSRSPLGNKHHTEYDTMGKFVENHLPGLFKLTPPEKEPKLPAEGVPSPKELRETLEKIWTKEREPTPEEIKEIYKTEGDQMGFGGGGGGSSGRSRPKAPKAPVPSAAFEIMKGNVIRLIKEEPAKRVVLKTLFTSVKKIKDRIENLKEGEYIDAGDVIDGLVFLLKHLQNTIKMTSAHPSAKQVEKPADSPGAPKFTGTPDFPIDNLKEAEDLLDKIVDIYKEINHYIEPDKVTTFPKADKPGGKSNSDLNKAITTSVFPRGLTEWVAQYSKEKGTMPEKPEAHPKYKGDIYEPTRPKAPEKPGAPKTQPFTGKPQLTQKKAILDTCQMSVDIAAKFAGTELTKDELEALLS